MTLPCVCTITLLGFLIAAGESRRTIPNRHFGLDSERNGSLNSSFGEMKSDSLLEFHFNGTDDSSFADQVMEYDNRADVPWLGDTFPFLGKLAKRMMRHNYKKEFDIDMSVGKCKVEMLKNRFVFKNMKVKNPPGYESEYFLTIDKAVVQMESRKERKKDDPEAAHKMVIEQVTFTGFKTTIEFKSKSFDGESTSTKQIFDDFFSGKFKGDDVFSVMALESNAQQISAQLDKSDANKEAHNKDAKTKADAGQKLPADGEVPDANDDGSDACIMKGVTFVDMEMTIMSNLFGQSWTQTFSSIEEDLDPLEFKDFSKANDVYKADQLLLLLLKSIFKKVTFDGGAQLAKRFYNLLSDSEGFAEEAKKRIAGDQQSIFKKLTID